MRRLLPLVVLLLLAVASPAAQARLPIRVGIGDQGTAMFDQPAFQRAKFERVRYFIPWNAMDDDAQRLAARTYVETARAHGFQVLLHISTDDFTSKRAHLPSVAEYHAEVGRLVRYFRGLGVREFGTWNEANHASQPTYRSPTRAAQFFEEMYRMVKGSCASCGVVALDVLDQTGVERYMTTFFAHLSPTFRKRATIVGLHNYGDVNRLRTVFTRNVIHITHRYNTSAKIWFTETGGLVEFGADFPCNTTRAANRITYMFSLAKTYRTAGVARIYVYNWTGAGCDARFDAGLTAPDGTPRKGYDALRAQLGNYER
ncbi:MAG: hypothetical protein JWQ18_2411 [Conexibacter sp.]|nr:hypothetical protein [Conexibacter sp.]